MAQDLRQVGRPELTGSTGAVGQRGKPDSGLLIDWNVSHANLLIAPV
jgi:hypothetical protein